MAVSSHTIVAYRISSSPDRSSGSPAAILARFQMTSDDPAYKNSRNDLVVLESERSVEPSK